MSARRSPVERDARRLAAIDLRIEHKHHNGRSAIELLQASGDSLATNAANRLLAGDLPAARRYAHAYRLVTESRARLRARQIRDRDARYAREAAEHGIRVNQTVRNSLGELYDVEAVEGNLLTVRDENGAAAYLWVRDVEVVDPETASADEGRVHDVAEAEQLAYAEDVAFIRLDQTLCADCETLYARGAAHTCEIPPEWCDTCHEWEAGCTCDTSDPADAIGGAS